VSKIEDAIALVIFLLGVTVGAMCMGHFVKAYWMKAAVEHGAAEFAITDSTSGKTEFRWKERKSP
jgi:hypothetical protein